MVVWKCRIIKSPFLQKQNNYLFFFLIIFTLCNTHCITNKTFIPNEGDLLFQDLDSSPLCDAIEKVTKSFENNSFSHIGIVVLVKNKHYVLEAFTNGVDTILLDVFLNRSLNSNKKPKVVVGRLQTKYSTNIPEAIEIGVDMIGKKYDPEFKLNNNKYYCSELIYDMFLLANNNHPVFELQPMTFKVNNTTLDVWIRYFQELGVEIPEQEPGINPGSMSLSEKIDIIYSYN